jgi:hypothetical protein
VQLFGTTPIIFGTIKISVKCIENDLSLCILLKHVKKYGRLFIGCSRLCTGIIIDKQIGSDNPKLYIVDVNDWSQSLNKYTTQWSLSPTTKICYWVLFRNISFCQSDRKILKSTNFIFHLSGCNSLTWTEFLSSPENYSTKSGDTEPSVTPVNREGLSCWAVANPQLLWSCYSEIYISRPKHETGISVPMTKMHQITVLHLIIFFCS